MVTRNAALPFRWKGKNKWERIQYYRIPAAKLYSVRTKEKVPKRWGTLQIPIELALR